ncbi:MAG: S41 family peptidase [Cyclobacteriaceae bacterium]
MLKQLSLLLFMIASFAVVGQQNPLIISPSLNSDGTAIAFSYQGDILTADADGSNAKRLTIHEGYETFPQWSADGSQIAFSSDRYGNHDIFTIPVGGGTPNRLTYHSASDHLSSWSADGQLVFGTRRLYAQVEREWEIYTSSPDGSTPVRLMDALGFDAAYSPDQSMIAFVRGTCRTAREAYQGPANRNVWLYHVASNEYSQVTTFEGNDFNPAWKDNSTLLFISSESGKYNIHEATLSSDKKSVSSTRQITTETEFGLMSFGASRNGQKLVYNTLEKLAIIDIASGAVSEVSVDLGSDYRFDPIVKKTISNDMESYAISPNGKYAAYITRGEVFVTSTDKEITRTRRITATSGRELLVDWLNDSTLVYSSDQDGQYDLFAVASADAEESNIFKTLKLNHTRITNTPDDEMSFHISPDAKQIAILRDRGVLAMASISGKGALANERVMLDGWSTPSGISWSPDSKWLAYSLSDLDFNEEVYIHKADNSTAPINVSMHPRSDEGPFWSPDGSKLGFVSIRNNGDYDVWFAWLNKEDWERTQEEWKRSGEEEDDTDDEADVIVKVDTEGIYERLTQVTSAPGNESDIQFSNDGETIYYVTSGGGRQGIKVDENLYSVKWDGKERKELLGGDQSPEDLFLSEDGKSLFALTKGGKLVNVDVKAAKSETISATAKMEVDVMGERDQMFEEAWRTLDKGFYDPNFHGQDFNALKAQYKPIALQASTQEDFQEVFNLMLGQLNASHMGMYRVANPKETQKDKTGLIGAELRPANNGLEVSAIVPESPADKAASKLTVGDKIIGVGSEMLDGQSNFYSLMNDKANAPLLLTVRNAAGAQREVVIWPVASLRTELYNSWVKERRRLTDEYSNGQLGYLHIQGMNWTSFERFERDLMAAGYGKKGIVIDVRYNGGGWTTDYLMTVLSAKQHAYTIPRGASDNLDADHLQYKEKYPFGERYPLAAWTKPAVTICNESSYSNAEIFSHAFKTLDRGTLVGKATFGAVISTGGRTLIDGALIRLPFRAWYVKATEENMELGPAVPDVFVENPPAYKAAGIDPQLEKSVEVLLREME